MAQETLFNRIAQKAPGVVGEGLEIVGGVVDVFKRKPNVKAWAKAKRAEKRRLKAMGISKAEQRQLLGVWLSANPKPRGNDPYNPVNLGVSNQMNPNAQANIQNPAQNVPFGGGVGIAKPVQGGFNFMNPIFLLIAIPILASFLFPKQFKRLRKSIRI